MNNLLNEIQRVVKETGATELEIKFRSSRFEPVLTIVIKKNDKIFKDNYKQWMVDSWKNPKQLFDLLIIRAKEYLK